MRIRREKAIRKTLSFYKLHGGTGQFESPYKILCDGNLIVASFRFKVPILDRLRKIYQGETFHLYTTKSIKEEIEGLLSSSSKLLPDKDDDTDSKNNNKELFQNALSFINQQCTIILDTHKEEGVDDNNITNLSKKISKKLKHMSKVANDIYKITALPPTNNNNNNSYFVATQDEELRSLLRNNYNVIIPLLYINKTGILLLESPSTSSQRTVQVNENKKIKNTILQKEQELATKIKKQNNKRKLDQIKTLQQKQIIESGMIYRGDRVKKRAKGPNPLSCKKKK